MAPDDYREAGAGAQATAQRERIKPGSAAKRFQAVSQASIYRTAVLNASAHRNHCLSSMW